MCRPLARLRPSVRVRIRSRSKWASLPSTPRIKRPALVPVSANRLGERAELHLLRSSRPSLCARPSLSRGKSWCSPRRATAQAGRRGRSARRWTSGIAKTAILLAHSGYMIRKRQAINPADATDFPRVLTFHTKLIRRRFCHSSRDLGSRLIDVGVYWLHPCLRPIRIM